MRLLALDQSSHISGYAIFEDNNLIESGTFTLKPEDLGQRLVEYRKKVEKLICDNDIDEIAFEDIQMQGQINNVQTFKVLAEIFGVTQEYLAEHQYNYQVIHSNTWKSKIGIKSKTRAEQKKETQTYILNKYKKKVSSDEADAIAIGECAVSKYFHKPDFNWG